MLLIQLSFPLLHRKHNPKRNDLKMLYNVETCGNSSVLDSVKLLKRNYFINLHRPQQCMCMLIVAEDGIYGSFIIADFNNISCTPANACSNAAFVYVLKGAISTSNCYVRPFIFQAM